MIRHFTFRLTFSLACLMLASCATFKAPVSEEQLKKEPAAWAKQQQERQQINTWEIRGRLGVQTENNGGSMDIIWKQADDEYSIRLIAPLGSGSYLIQGNSAFVEVRYPDGETKIIDNLDDVFASTLNVELPANAIKDWIRGMPASALTVNSIRWNEQGLLHKIKQSGWNVEMTNYNGNKILLPHSIYLTRDDRPELDIRLVLRQWLIDN
jgi:outer membrane lipoprotein LolB